MPKSSTGGATATRKPIRRYNLSADKRHFLVNAVLPQYIERMEESATAMLQLAKDGGSGLITTDGAKMMAQMADANATTATEIMETLSGASDDSDDDEDDTGDLGL